MNYRHSPAWGNEFSFVEPMHRFMESIDLGDDGCWLWNKSTDINGYSQFSIRGQMMKGHRFIYEVYVGVIEGGLELDHLCRVRHCVNPEHLEAVTHAENLRRMPKHRPHTWADTCKAGHSLSEGNYFIRSDSGTKRCRVCHNIKSIRDAKRKKEIQNV